MPRPVRTLAVALGVLSLAGCAAGSTEASTDASTTSSGSTMAEPPTVTPPVSTETAVTTTTTIATPPEATTTVPSPPPCTAVAHIGDSTSVGMVSSSYLPDPSTRLDAQYARVGVAEHHLEIDGARSIVETHHGSPNARDVAMQIRAGGFHGCWVFALGTTDAANVGAGSRVGPDERIDRMMAVAGSDPVLWVKVKTLLPSGAWSNENMQAFNHALDAAERRYPNLHTYDWPAVVQDRWYDADGIHYTSEGFAARARLIADAIQSLRS